MRTHLVAILSITLFGCASSPTDLRPMANRVPIESVWTPTVAEVTKGVSATQSSCAAIENAVWADAGSSGSECIRFWKSSGLAGNWDRTVAFFPGDVWTGNEVDPTYLQLTEQWAQQVAEEWGGELAAPYILIGRPGTFGSSGDHMQRRRKAESDILSAALDALKKRFSIREFALAGQSGGGHVVASLIVKRSDIVCAVPTSAVSSPRARWVINGWNQDSTGYADSYEPAEFLTKNEKHPSLRLFVVGSLEDRNTPWTSQLLLSGRARTLGIPTLELLGQGAGSAKHGMANSGRRVAGWCANGLTNEQIQQKAKEGLSG
jgi:hypothetical protein